MSALTLSQLQGLLQREPEDFEAFAEMYIGTVGGGAGGGVGERMEKKKQDALQKFYDTTFKTADVECVKSILTKGRTSQEVEAMTWREATQGVKSILTKAGLADSYDSVVKSWSPDELAAELNELLPQMRVPAELHEDPQLSASNQMSVSVDEPCFIEVTVSLSAHPGDTDIPVWPGWALRSVSLNELVYVSDRQTSFATFPRHSSFVALSAVGIKGTDTWQQMFAHSSGTGDIALASVVKAGKDGNSVLHEAKQAFMVGILGLVKAGKDAKVCESLPGGCVCVSFNPKGFYPAGFGGGGAFSPVPHIQSSQAPQAAQPWRGFCPYPPTASGFVAAQSATNLAAGNVAPVLRSTPYQAHAQRSRSTWEASTTVNATATTVKATGGGRSLTVRTNPEAEAGYITKWVQRSSGSWSALRRPVAAPDPASDVGKVAGLWREIVALWR